MIRRLLAAVIGLYRLLVSPMLGYHCRFHPSCSSYAQEAVLRHGALRGTLLALGRLMRCHPWHPGGVDPVPDRVRSGGAGREDRPSGRLS